MSDSIDPFYQNAIVIDEFSLDLELSLHYHKTVSSENSRVAQRKDDPREASEKKDLYSTFNGNKLPDGVTKIINKFGPYYFSFSKLGNKAIDFLTEYYRSILEIDPHFKKQKISSTPVVQSKKGDFSILDFESEELLKIVVEQNDQKEPVIKGHPSYLKDYMETGAKVLIASQYDEGGTEYYLFVKDDRIYQSESHVEWSATHGSYVETIISLDNAKFTTECKKMLTQLNELSSKLNHNLANL